jgi:hypothetical protein
MDTAIDIIGIGGAGGFLASSLHLEGYSSHHISWHGSPAVTGGWTDNCT